jgi:hypothetical protein
MCWWKERGSEKQKTVVNTASLIGDYKKTTYTPEWLRREQTRITQITGSNEALKSPLPNTFQDKFPATKKPLKDPIGAVPGTGIFPESDAKKPQKITRLPS